MPFVRCLCIAMLCVLAFGGVRVAAADEAGNPEEQLRTLLKAHPELILDVLEEHSLQLLEIIQKGAEKRRRDSLHTQWEQDRKLPKKVAVEGRPVGGPAQAPITIVAFSDFLCSYCHQAAFTLGSLMKEYKGKIRFVFKQVPKDETGMLVSRWFLAAYHTDKARAWRMYALLFDHQAELEEEPRKTLLRITHEVGLEASLIEENIKKNGSLYADILDGDAADAKALGFVGTPYFLVNDMVLRGALPMESFEDAVQKALEQPAPKK